MHSNNTNKNGKVNVPFVLGQLFSDHQYYRIFYYYFHVFCKIGNLNIIKANRLNFGAVRKVESVLYDLASHDLSMILSITQDFPVKVDVNAVFKNSKTVADYINVILYFKNDLHFNREGNQLYSEKIFIEAFK